MTSAAVQSPLIIIGAGRSGTNMLRDLLVQFPGYGTWPCDEINYIWRHGNARYPNDEFQPELATQSVAHSIRRSFAVQARTQSVQTVVEKTCANSLRVGFVRRIFPDARFVYIVRDGRDVVASAMKRWSAPLDLPYILRKARYVPVSDIPYYASRYIANHVHRITSGEKRLAFWGPRYKGMAEDLQTRSLAEVCALQWRRCVERAEADLALMPQAQVYRLSYEQFVQNPTDGIADLATFLAAEIAPGTAAALAGTVSTASVGKWQRDLTAVDQQQIVPLLEPRLRAYAYV